MTVLALKLSTLFMALTLAAVMLYAPFMAARAHMNLDALTCPTKRC